MTHSLAAAALLLAPQPWARDLAAPDYPTRQAAQRRLESLGTRATPICAALWRHRDPEVRNRARLAWESVSLIPPPARWPTSWDMARTLPLPGRLAWRLWYAAGHGTAQELIDGLTYRGLPVSIAGAWVARAAAPPRAPGAETP